jgi:septum formation protein
MKDIDAYCRTDEPWGKAGAYGIQGKASLFVQHIHGSYSGVVGLPIYETGQLLRQLGESHTD